MLNYVLDPFAGDVVICRLASNFAGATPPGIYFDRDCSRRFHTDAVAFAGGSKLERRTSG